MLQVELAMLPRSGPNRYTDLWPWSWN
jgi:hypothetical protein